MTAVGVCLLVTLLAGCASTPAEPDGPRVVAADRYDAVFDAAVAVLRDRGFRVDRRDYRFGRITTAPLDSPTVFEPWRPHNSNLTQVGASTLGHLQRRVNVMLDAPTADESVDRASPDGPSAIPPYALTVEVILERQQLPLRRLTGTAQRSRIDALRAVPAEWQQRGIAASYAQPVARDAEMERELVAAILRRAETK